DLEIRGEENSVLMLDEKLVNLFSRMTTNLRDARGEIGVHIRIAIEHPLHPVDLFCIVRKMDADECRLRMPFDDAIERLEQLHPRRVNVGVAKPPASMVLQFGPALV